MLGVFRLVALIEGITTIALFFVAMPLKYVFGNPALVPVTGMAHGIAFMAYAVIMIPAMATSRPSAFGWLRTGFAAFIPLGTFINDPYLQGLQQRRRAWVSIGR